MAIPAKTKVRINLVAFVVLSVALIYAMATQVLSLLEDRYSVLATFRDSGGVFTNQEVTYRGVTVGQVGELSIVEEGVQIELKIDEGVRIPADGTEARVMFKSAVGEQFVDVLPVSKGPPFLEDGSEIPIERTSIPVSTQSLLTTLEAVLRGVPPKALHGAIDALGTGLTERGEDIAEILESTADLAELFAARSPEVEGILREGTKLGGAFLASREDFARAISELVVVSESLAGSTGDLERLLRGANATSDELVALLRKHRPALHRLLIELAEVNDLQAEHADDLGKILTRFPTALAAVIKSFEPKTGLIRFGSIFNEYVEPEACSYGTERRQPENRSNRLPPKKARCGDAKRGEGGAGGASGGGGRRDEDVSIDTSRREALPSTMAGWSWSLFYLNGL